MEQNFEQLCKAVKKIAWGYILIHVHINIGTLDLLADWWGCLLFYQALTALGTYEPSAFLLKPLGIVMILWEAVTWILTAIGITIPDYLPGLVIAIISLYFHFQLLTNVASIAKKYECPQEGSLLTLRTLQTLFITLLALPLPWEEYEIAAILLLLVNLIIAIALCVVLFGLHKALQEFHDDSTYNNEVTTE